MPRKFKFTKEEILTAALQLTREKGISALTARGLGEKLGSSSKPIFSQFENMEEVQNAVIHAADKVYQASLKEAMANGQYPPYKASGMAYIHFAKTERELFKLLFMRDRTCETITENKEEIRPLLDLLKKNLGLEEEDAYFFHLEMWICVHGIASMLATSYLEWDEDFISRVLTDTYEGIKLRYMKGTSLC